MVKIVTQTRSVEWPSISSYQFNGYSWRRWSKRRKRFAWEGEGLDFHSRFHNDGRKVKMSYANHCALHAPVGNDNPA